MTREEDLAYRRGCPYDAMGDYSVFSEKTEHEENEKTEDTLPDIPTRQVK